jgi:solute carrier family 25 aspartate/glutamate transporter 12/13
MINNTNNTNNTNNINKTNKNIINGLIGGMVGGFGVLPIDMLKTRVQNNVYNKVNIEIIRNIIKREGIMTFYRGGIPQLVFVAPEKAIKFVMNDYMIEKTDNKIIAGMTAGFSQVLFTNPMEIMKIQMQMNINKKINKSIIETLREIRYNVYRGSTLCFMRDIPFSGIYFPLNRYIEDRIENNYISSLTSGMISAYVCTPMDMIKTRIQSNMKLSKMEVIRERIEMLKNMDNRGIIRRIKNVKEIFFRGGEWRMLKSGPQFMITQIVYDKLK